MSNASVYTMDPEVKESNIRGQVMRQGTERLSKFVKRKQMQYKNRPTGGGQKGADLGARVSGQKILE